MVNTHTFINSCKIEAMAEKWLNDNFWGHNYHLVEKVEDLSRQYGGEDFHSIGPDGVKHIIQLKARAVFFGDDVLIETISNDTIGRKGWICDDAPTIILYTWSTDGYRTARYLVADFKQLQKFHNLNQHKYNKRTAKNYKNGSTYNTIFYCVPYVDLFPGTILEVGGDF